MRGISRFEPYPLGARSQSGLHADNLSSLTSLLAYGTNSSSKALKTFGKTVVVEHPKEVLTMPAVHCEILLFVAASVPT